MTATDPGEDSADPTDLFTITLTAKAITAATIPPKHRRYPKNLATDPFDAVEISESISQTPARTIKTDKITKIIMTATATGEDEPGLADLAGLADLFTIAITTKAITAATRPPKHRRYPKNLATDPFDAVEISESISQTPARTIKTDKITKIIMTATATGEDEAGLADLADLADLFTIAITTKAITAATKPPKHRRYPKNLATDPMDPSDAVEISESISQPPARTIKTDKITKIIMTTEVEEEDPEDPPDSPIMKKT
ncbi:uncharacterized protein BdWA1_003986 [Babesia duncani]|uniref:Uncharacterized protein n=1 Tax=Babesia duncani TaxID=323732 RepID=A0AAD9UMD5_9APIC|nr:hypothetical protein BdWA1_003986 [Babesia duncani]